MQSKSICARSFWVVYSDLYWKELWILEDHRSWDFWLLIFFELFDIFVCIYRLNMVFPFWPQHCYFLFFQLDTFFFCDDQHNSKWQSKNVWRFGICMMMKILKWWHYELCLCPGNLGNKVGNSSADCFFFWLLQCRKQTRQRRKKAFFIFYLLRSIIYCCSTFLIIWSGVWICQYLYME